MFFIYPLGLQTVGLGAWFNSHGEDTGDMGKEDIGDLYPHIPLSSPWSPDRRVGRMVYVARWGHRRHEEKRTPATWEKKTPAICFLSIPTVSRP